jgi:hypothetical protein
VTYIVGSLAIEVAHPQVQEPPPHRETAGAAPEAAGPHQPKAGAAAGLDSPAHDTGADRYLWGLHRVLDGLSRDTLG